MKRNLFPAFWAATFFLVVATSCATTTFKSLSRNTAYGGGPLKKVLIIGVDTNPMVRELLENEFARQLKEAGTAAVPGHTILSGDEELDKGMIVSKMKEHSIDSVLEVTVTDVKATGTYESYPPYSSVGDFAIDYLGCCQYVSTGRDVLIQTKLFGAKFDELIWSALSETVIESPSLKFSIESFARAVTRSLRDEKLLK
jgi:hypothetical protein